MVVTVVFGVRVKYTPGAYHAIVTLQCTAICLAAWRLGARAIAGDEDQPRRLAAAGSFLVAPWALFSFLAGIGPPGGQTAEENQLRYLILLINAIAVAAGLVFLREALVEAGERFHSTLGFVAILLATPLYLIWATLLLAEYRTLAQLGEGKAPPWIRWMSDPSDILLFFGGLLTYLAAAAFAASLGRARWLDRTAARVCVVVSLFAALCLATRGLRFPDPAVATGHWQTIPGFVVGIPAIPWMMPCLFGVLVLRRAGSEHK